MQLDELFVAMTEFNRGNAHQIQHFTKVHAYAAFIGRREGLDERTQRVLEAAALVHDIGITPAMEKYGRSDGPLQEKEGEPIALELLNRLGMDRDEAKRVSFLVGTHHTLRGVEGIDHAILLEADMLVNLHEGAAPRERAEKALEEVFVTQTGKKLCRDMYGI